MEKKRKICLPDKNYRNFGQKASFNVSDPIEKSNYGPGINITNYMPRSWNAKKINIKIWDQLVESLSESKIQKGCSENFKRKSQAMNAILVVIIPYKRKTNFNYLNNVDWNET